MTIPKITGTIDRRILINYRADKEVIRRFLPQPFQPKLVDGGAMVGICLIRLKHIRPKGFPFKVGISSENAAHRIAVEWSENGVRKEGVFVPRRDTSSRLNSWAGGRVFPGVHHLARFNVKEYNDHYQVQFISEDGTHLSIVAENSYQWNQSSSFKDIQHASDFFKQGSLGYSPSKTSHSFDGLELKTMQWKVSSMDVSKVNSSFFEDRNIFPDGSIVFDNALLMRNIEHEWSDKGSMNGHIV